MMMNRASLVTFTSRKSAHRCYYATRARPEKTRHTTKVTLDELAKADGRGEETPIYTCFKGDVYDLSSRRDLFGPTGPFHFLAGRDGTFAFIAKKHSKEILDSPVNELLLDAKQEKKIEKSINRYRELFPVVGECVNSPSYRVEQPTYKDIDEFAIEKE